MAQASKSITMVPYLGATVIYIDRYCGEHWASIVTQVLGDGNVFLTTFAPMTAPYAVQGAVPMDLGATRAKHSWYWPIR